MSEAEGERPSEPYVSSGPLFVLAGLAFLVESFFAVWLNLGALFSVGEAPIIALAHRLDALALAPSFLLALLGAGLWNWHATTRRRSGTVLIAAFVLLVLQAAACLWVTLSFFNWPYY